MLNISKHHIIKGTAVLILSVTACVSCLSGCIRIEEPDNKTVSRNNSALTSDNTTIYLPPLEHDFTVQAVYEDVERIFIVHVCQSYVPLKSYPLVFVLHGGGSRADIMPPFTGFNAIADREDFIAVYPQGIENHWNDGREPKVYRTHIDDTDDVGFISTIIDLLKLELNIDMERIYATGISNGGMMSHRLGCELSDRIAAIAPVASGIPVNTADKWDPDSPLPVLIINGTDDPLVPWDGGEIIIDGVRLGNVLSAEDTTCFWAEKNHCTGMPEMTRLSERNTLDGTSVWKKVYRDRTGEVRVVLYGIQGGGHTWPGGMQYASEELIGITSREFDASEIIWQFFEKYPKK